MGFLVFGMICIFVVVGYIYRFFFGFNNVTCVPEMLASKI